MSNRKILDAVESLIGGEIFSNPVYNTRPKVPKVSAGAVPWHQDRSYWPAILFNDRCIHMSTPNLSNGVRWSCDLRYQPIDQDPMIEHGAGFLARSRKFPQRVAQLDDWLASRPEHDV